MSGKIFFIVCGGIGGYFLLGIVFVEGFVVCGYCVMLLISYKKVDVWLVEKYLYFIFFCILGLFFIWKLVGFVCFFW